MEQLFVLLVLALIVGVLLGPIGFFRAGAARRELRDLQRTVAQLRAEVAGMAAALAAAGFRPPGPPPGGPAAAWQEAPAAAEAARERPIAGESAEAAPAARPAAAEPGEPPPVRRAAAAEAAAAGGPAAPPPFEPEAQPVAGAMPAAPKRSLEETLTLRWGVWLGAAALLLAAIFLLRIAVEEGWLGPEARCVLAALLGFALIAAGEWLERRPLTRKLAMVRPDHAPPALTAGGVAALLGTAYAATNLYALLTPPVGFLAMAGAGVLGLLLALRQGPVVGAIGLAGAFLTPALVATADPSAPGLFAYLLVVTAAAMAVVRFTAWAWLGWCAVVAGALWAFIGTFMAKGGDAWAPALFVPLAAALHLALLPGAALAHPVGRRLSWVPMAALAAALLPAAAGDGAIAWAVGILLLTPVALWKGAVEPRLDWLPWLAAALGLALLGVWQVPAWSPTGEGVKAGEALIGILPGDWAPEQRRPYLIGCAALGLMHLAGGLAIEGRAARPVRWAALGGVPVLVLLLAYARVRGFNADTEWALAALALAVVLTGAASRAAGAQQAWRAGAHAASATAALALGVAMVLRAQWLTLSVSLFLPPLGAIALRTGLRPLRYVAAAVAAVVLVRLALNGAVLGYGFGATPVLNGLLIAYGGPALAFAIAARLFLRQGDGPVIRLLEAGAGLLASLLVVLEIRHAMQGGDLGAFRWTLLEQGLQASALFLLAWATLLLQRRSGRSALGMVWRGQGVVGLTLGVLMLLNNPWSSGEAIHGPLILNPLLAAYAIPAILAGIGVARVPELRDPPGLPSVLGAYTLFAAFAWVTLTVRQAFHPGAMGQGIPVEEAELWTYSGAWLGLGALLLALGIRARRRELRFAALAVIALVTFKVFLVDMDELVGLWRVLSFLGLGLALIGLGAVYQRFVLPR